MSKLTKKFEVSLSETKYGYAIVEAKSRHEAIRLALQNYHQGDVTMGDNPEIETKSVKEVALIGFKPY
jgi:hypothetical protein